MILLVYLLSYIFATATNITPQDLTNPAKPKIYTTAEVMPQYPDGEANMMKYIFDNLKVTTVGDTIALSSQCIVRFVVGDTGKITDIQILRSLGDDFDKNIIAIIQSMPEWKPALIDNKPVSCYYTLPIRVCFRK